MPRAGETVTVSVLLDGLGSGKFPLSLLMDATGSTVTGSPLTLTAATGFTETYEGHFVMPTGSGWVRAVTTSYDDTAQSTVTPTTTKAIDIFEEVNDLSEAQVSALTSDHAVGTVDETGTVIGLVDDTATIIGIVDDP